MELSKAANTHVLGIHGGNSIVTQITRRRGLTIGHRHWMRARKASLLSHAWELSAHFESVSEVALRLCRGRITGLTVEDAGLTWSSPWVSFEMWTETLLILGEISPPISAPLLYDAGVCTY